MNVVRSVTGRHTSCVSRAPHLANKSSTNNGRRRGRKQQQQMTTIRRLSRSSGGHAAVPAAQAFESDEAPASAAAAPIKARLHDEEAPAASVVVSRDVEDLYVVHDEQDSFNLSTSADLAVRGGTTTDGDALSKLVHAEAEYTTLQPREATGIHLEVDDADDNNSDRSSAAVFELDPPSLAGSTTDEFVDIESPIIADVLVVEDPVKIRRRASSLTLGEVVAFSLPAFAGIINDPLMSFVDTACVGKISSLQLAALGPNTAVFGFVLQVFTCFITYTCAQVSKLQAKGKHDDMFREVSNTLVMGVLTGTAVGAGLWIFAHPLFAALGVQPELMALAVHYLRIRALALPAVAVCMVAGATCLGKKDSKTPMIVAFASAGANLLGDVALIFGPWGMGIAGAAIATTASVWLAAGLFIAWGLRGMPLRWQLPSVGEITRFAKVSALLTARNVCIMSTMVVMASKAGEMGTVAAAAHQVAASIFLVGNLCGEPLSQAAQSFLAAPASMQRRGPEEHGYLMDASMLLTRCITVVAGVAGVLAWLGCGCPALFTSDPVVASAVGAIGLAMGAAVVLAAGNCVSDGLAFASGDYKVNTLFSVVNLPIVLAMVARATTLQGIWMAFAAFYALRLSENFVRIAYINKMRRVKGKTV